MREHLVAVVVDAGLLIAYLRMPHTECCNGEFLRRLHVHCGIVAMVRASGWSSDECGQELIEDHVLVLRYIDCPRFVVEPIAIPSWMLRMEFRD